MPPLDPSIILGIKPPQIDSPDQRQAKALALEHAMGQQEAQRLQLEGVREARADENAVRDAYRQSGGDSAILRRLLTEGGRYKQIQALDKAEQDRLKGAADVGNLTSQTKEREFKMKMDALSRTSSILYTARDQGSYDTARRQIAQEFGPDAIANMPPQFDPRDVQARLAAGLKFTEQLDAEHKKATLAETVRGHNLTAQTAREGHGVQIRGQNIAAGTAREGHAVTRRGQDLTNARAVEQNDPAFVQRRAEAQAYGKETGESKATAQARLPQATANAERAIRLVDEMVGSEDGKVRRHPGFSTAVGTSGIQGGFGLAGFVPGTDTSDFKARFEELQGGQFLQAFESLKGGGGAITDIEGQKATAAISRMKLAQSENEFVTAAREFQNSVKKMVEVAKQKAAGGRGGVNPGVNPANLSDAELKRELGIK